MQIFLGILMWGAIITGVFFLIRNSRRNAAAAALAGKERQKAMLAKLIEVYGAENGMLIYNKKITFGFDQQMVLYAWGRPAHKTQKAAVNKISDRWYFEQYTTERGNVKYQTYVDFVNNEVVAFGDVEK
jgi:hypothetical protein